MHVKTIRQPLIAGIIASVCLSLTASAQSTSGSYEPELTAIVLETTVDVANLKIAGGVPPLLSTLVSAGAQIRSRVDNYDPIGRTMRISLYLTAPSAPLPLPASALPPATDAAMLSQSVIRAETIYHSKGSLPSLAIAGRFASFLGGQLPVAVGTPFLLSFAYPAEALNAGGSSNATFAESSFLIPGSINIYSAAPVGSVTVLAPPSN